MGYANIAFRGSFEVCDLVSASRLMWASVLSELIRELRFWAPQPSCVGPAAIALLVLISCILGACAGSIITGLCLSTRLRRATGFLFWVFSDILEERATAIGEPRADIRERRLREYRE